MALLSQGASRLMRPPAARGPLAPPPAAMPHLPQLDGLRAVAVSLVFAAHAGLEAVVPGGLGVTIFFFLSGYLITTLLRCEMGATDGVSLRNFYLRRTLRIIPPLYLTMAFAAGLYALGGLSGRLDGVAVLAQAVFLTNYAGLFSSADGLPLPLWSLAVEEHFYLVFPLAFSLCLGRAGGGRAAAICLLACLLVLGARVGGVWLLTDSADTYIWTHTRIDSILFGSCLALWRNPVLDGPAAYRPRRWHVGAALIVLAATLGLRDELFRQTMRYSLQGGALFVLFAAILAPPEARPAGIRTAVRLLSRSIARRVGLYSYTIYLVHVVMLDLAGRVPAPAPIQVGVGLVLTLVYAEAMYRFVERPASSLRRQLDVPREVPISGRSRGRPWAGGLTIPASRGRRAPERQSRPVRHH